MKNTISTTLPTILLAALFALPAGAADELVYADRDGTVVTVALETVSKSDGNTFVGYIRVGGRRKKLTLEARRVIFLQRGDGDAINQWSKRLAHGLRLMAAGRIANEGPASGAEETFAKIAYTIEKGTKGQEATEQVQPWQNMYAGYYLILARQKLGEAGNEAKLNEALDAIAQFRKRSAAKAKAKLAMQIPDYKGGARDARVFGWGANRLSVWVDLAEAQVLAALKQADKSKAAYDKVISEAVKKAASPQLLVQAIMEKAQLEAAGKEAQQQETIFRSAGTKMRSVSGRQPDGYGKKVLTRAANQALLMGADLLFTSALDGKYGIQVPLERYTTLLNSSEGRADPALKIGAETGVGMCLVEQGGNGQKAYEALLAVALNGSKYPSQVARALYYLSKAAPQYADALEKSGGSGAFLREEASRWTSDLKERYPASEWAKKAGS